VVRRYEDVLRGTPARLPQHRAEARPAYVRYPVFVPDRAAAVDALSRHTVPGLWFTSVLEEARRPSELGYRAGDCPNAEACACQLVNLPTHPRVSLRQADRIAGALAAAVGPAATDYSLAPALTAG
jgi:dTDP-4-amino-4,6-dideoxygalactose transaminase